MPARLQFSRVPLVALLAASVCSSLACDDTTHDGTDNIESNSVVTASNGASSSAPNANTSGASASSTLPSPTTPATTLPSQTGPGPTNTGTATSPSSSVEDEPSNTGGGGTPPSESSPPTGGTADDPSDPPEPSDSASASTPDTTPTAPSTADAGGNTSAPDEPTGGGTSPGCGTPTTLQDGHATIDVDGAQREYILTLPNDYDPSRAYKLIVGLHWRGGQASDVSSGTIGLGDYYGLKDLAEDSAIFVSPNGLDNGWANPGGDDIAFMRTLIEHLGNESCIDLDRIFSVGFSYGGMMSFAIACEMGDVFRAIAPLSGATYSGCGNGTEPIAMWGAHGKSDDVVPIDDGRAGLQEVLDRNHCDAESSAVEPSPCVTYSGCDEGYPVTWCEFDGGHSPQGWQSQPIWDFFSQF